jgi:hypothetical protein
MLAPLGVLPLMPALMQMLKPMLSLLLQLALKLALKQTLRPMLLALRMLLSFPMLMLNPKLVPMSVLLLMPMQLWQLSQLLVPVWILPLPLALKQSRRPMQLQPFVLSTRPGWRLRLQPPWELLPVLR